MNPFVESFHSALQLVGAADSKLFAIVGLSLSVSALATLIAATLGLEVGAVMIVGGNIDGVTRVMTTAIALETSKGDLPLALALGMVLLGVVLLLNVLIAGLREWRLRADDVVSAAA